jgi:hypothetical protein
VGYGEVLFYFRIRVSFRVMVAFRLKVMFRNKAGPLLRVRVRGMVRIGVGSN